MTSATVAAVDCRHIVEHAHTALKSARAGSVDTTPGPLSRPKDGALGMTYDDFSRAPSAHNPEHIRPAQGELPKQEDGGDTVTVLTTFGPLATKIITPDGIKGYDEAAHFRVTRETVAGIGDLSRLLTGMVGMPRRFIIRGEPLPTANIKRCRRLLYEKVDPDTGEVHEPTFADRPRRWLLLDFDDIACPDWLDPLHGHDCGIYLRSLLPVEFEAASFWWSFTSGAGFKPGLRMRLAFWLDRPTWQEELDGWLKDAPVDHAIFRPIQANYVAAPIFRGVADPVPVRAGFCPDLLDAVEVPELPEPENIEEPMRPEGNLIGLLTKARPTGLGWPMDVLKAVALEVATTRPAGLNAWGGGGRHHALFCAARRCAGLVKDDFLNKGECEPVLVAAARQAGIAEAEAKRTIANAFRAGGV